MPVRELRVIRTLKKTVNILREMAELTAEMHKEAPRIQALHDAVDAVSGSVEKHMQRHFDRLIDVGMSIDRREEGIEILKHTKSIAEAYGVHKNAGNERIRREILEHVKHVGQHKDPEMIAVLGRVAEHLKDMHNDENVEKIGEILSHARNVSEPISAEEVRKRYIQRMRMVEQALREYKESNNPEALIAVLKKIRSE